MIKPKSTQNMIAALLVFILLFSLATSQAGAIERPKVTSGNFGLPGVIDLPTAQRFPDGELITTYQNHEYLHG